MAIGLALWSIHHLHEGSSFSEEEPEEVVYFVQINNKEQQKDMEKVWCVSLSSSPPTTTKYRSTDGNRRDPSDDYVGQEVKETIQLSTVNPHTVLFICCFCSSLLVKEFPKLGRKAKREIDPPQGATIMSMERDEMMMIRLLVLPIYICLSSSSFSSFYGLWSVKDVEIKSDI